MTLLPFAVLLYILLACASPLCLNGTSIHTVDASDSTPSNNTRTLWNICWSCGVTLFACAWTAVYPNIPGMEEKYAPFVRRIGIMAMVLFAPEVITTWASWQLFSAIAAAKKCNDALSSSWPAEFEEWTITHGFYAWMGGFMLYVDRIPRATLTPDELLQFVGDGSVEMPVILKTDIKDRSKGDILAKGVAVFQLVWFVLQLAARHAQNLPITLLEIDTLAIAVLTFVAYFLWWTKPMDVGRPHIVHWKSTVIAPPDRPLTYEQSHSGFNCEDRCFRFLFKLIYPCLSTTGIKGPIVSPDDVRSCRAPCLGGYGGHNDIDIAFEHITGRMMPKTPASTRSRRSGVLIGVAGASSGALLGGLHCLAWNFLFQRHAELILWRVASIMMACTPMYVLVPIHIGHLGMSWKYFMPILASFLYISARFIIFVLMLLSFWQSPPPGVYDTVDWTQFVPHW
ncbi:hypothetical protein EDB19DRAFT_1704880 [Suillus lakei]|nr:hypothetical protein EDB19DRAFT_1704880 [Suillus lakei]